MIASILLALRTSRKAQTIAFITVLIAVGIGVYVWTLSQNRAIIDNATDAGLAIQQRNDATETLNRTLEAINAEVAVRNDPAVRNASCLRHSRTPENCD